MSAKLKIATCHPNLPNYYGGKCEVCFSLYRDPNVPCLHAERSKDRFGRCTSCNSRYYFLKRKRGEVITRRDTVQRLGLEHISDPVELALLINRKRLLSNYSLTLSDYDELLESQNGVCAICGQPPPAGRGLTVDHDHSCCAVNKKSCGKCVRGLLCHGCNMRLGQLESGLLARSLKYLDEHKQLRS